MSELFEDPLLNPQLSEQKALLEPLIEELLSIDSEAENLATKQENTRRLKHLPIFNAQREIFKSIPQFWFHVLYNSEYYGAFFSPHDVQALKSLTDIEVEYDPSDASFYTITFHFPANGYFKNEMLKYQTVDNPDQKVKPITIDWLSPDKNIIELDKKVKIHSFFEFFVSGNNDEFGDIFITETMVQPVGYYNADLTEGFFGANIKSVKRRRDDSSDDSSGDSSESDSSEEDMA